MRFKIPSVFWTVIAALGLAFGLLFETLHLRV